MRSIGLLALFVCCGGCTTLENRRDLYTADRPYVRPVVTTVTMQQSTTTTRATTRTPAPQVRSLPEQEPPIPLDAPDLPPP